MKQPLTEDERTLLTWQRYYWGINIFLGLEILLILIFSEILCLFRKICGTKADIDIQPAASILIIPILISHFISAILSNQLIQIVVVYELFCKIIQEIILSLFEICVGIAVLILAKDNDRKDTWGSLTPLSKKYYDNDIKNLEDDYQQNMTVTGVLFIILALLQFIRMCIQSSLYRFFKNMTIEQFNAIKGSAPPSENQWQKKSQLKFNQKDEKEKTGDIDGKTTKSGFMQDSQFKEGELPLQQDEQDQQGQNDQYQQIQLEKEQMTPNQLSKQDLQGSQSMMYDNQYGQDIEKGFQDPKKQRKVQFQDKKK